MYYLKSHHTFRVETFSTGRAVLATANSVFIIQAIVSVLETKKKFSSSVTCGIPRNKPQ